MLVELDGFNGELYVDYLFLNGHPHGVNILLNTSDGFELVGQSEVKGTDQFSYLKGRKYALISMFRRDDAGEFGPPKLLSKEDRRVLFKKVCPKFFGKVNKEKEELSNKELSLLKSFDDNTITKNYTQLKTNIN